MSRSKLSLALLTLLAYGCGQPPIAADDTASTSEDTPVTIPSSELLADDSDKNQLQIASVQSAVNGSVLLAADGSSITFTPAPDFNGEASFEYTIDDGKEGSDTALVTVAVAAANDAPVAEDDTASTNEDTPLTIEAPGLLANDSDVDNDTLSVISVQDAQNGSVSLDGAQITFTPRANFVGEASFGYTVDDGNGGSDTAITTITVNEQNSEPVAEDDTASTDEDQPVQIPVLANDADSDGDSLTLASVQDAQSGSAQIVGDDVLFTPDENFHGEASFAYTLSDGSGGSASALVTVTVNPVNDAPVPLDDTFSTDEDTPLVLADSVLLANDSDIDGDALTISTVANAQGGAVALSGGQITFTPNLNFQGSAGFAYTITDGLASDTALVTVTVNAVNDAPVANDISVTTDEDTPLAITLTALDVDGDTLGFTVQTGPANGVLSGTAPNLTYTPDADFEGTDSFTFTASDGALTSNTATVSITVDAVDDVVDAIADTASTDEDLAVTTDVLANDQNLGDGGILVSLVSQPTDGTATLNADNSVTYTPNADFFGTDIYTYSIEDIDGNLDVATVTVTVNALDDAPVAQDDTASTDEDLAVTTDVLANDQSLGDGGIVVTITAQPANGAATVNADNSVTYTPDTDFFGADVYTYQVSDADGDTATATVSIAVGAVSDCGDAALQLDEECDDGNNTDGDGCSAACVIERCGDGLINNAPGGAPTEECDDGNNTDGDGCDAACVIEFCGDSLVNNVGTCTDIFPPTADVLAELELDGDAADQSGNGRDAVLIGGSFVQGACGQALQITAQDLDGNGQNDPMGLDWSAFASLLQHPYTVEMVLTPEDTSAFRKLFSHDDASDSGWHYVNEGFNDFNGGGFVGVGQMQAGERHYLAFVSTAPNQIDIFFQGNLIGSTTTSFTAPPLQAIFFRDDSQTNRREQLTALVDGLRISSVARTPEEILAQQRHLDSLIEECDDGNTTDGDGCSAVCALEFCGDGLINNAPDGAPTEECDDGNNLGGDGCDAACVIEFCGDGIVQAGLGEQCDDGDNLNDDGCDDVCQIEGGFDCLAGETLLQVSSTDVPKAIQDLFTTTSIIEITDAGTVRRAIVGIDDLAHTFDRDLDIVLVSPTGTRVLLTSDNGDDGDNFIDTIFDDNCLTVDGPIGNAAAPFTGCFSPQVPLADFSGEPSNGTWALEVTDNAPFDQGTLSAWTLGLCVQ